MRLRLAAFLGSVVLAAAPAVALEPYMVKDIDPLPQNQSSYPRGFVSLSNGIALFGANLSDFDPELWRSDGTPGGTYKLTDTCTSWYCTTAIQGLALAGDRLFYLAATRPEDQNATELWVTGGSAIDTFDLGGPFYPDPNNAPVWIESRGLLFFLAHDGDHRLQLWRSDGTAAGTYRLTDVRPDQPRSLMDLTEYRGKLYFASPASRGWTLWSSDGTLKGTKLVKDVPAYGLRSIGSALVSFGYDSKGWGLWRSDGTAKGTVRFASIAPAPRDMQIIEVVALAGRYYFMTSSTIQGEELWASNGTQAGTRRLTNFANKTVFYYDQATGTGYLPALAVGSRMVFSANDGVHGAEPWITDGTPAGTRLLRDLCPGACGSSPSERVPLGSRLIFAAITSAQGIELWVTDGTTAGTRLLRDICPGTCHSAFFGGARLGQGLMFRAGFTDNWYQAWKTDGTPRGTTRVPMPPEITTVREIGASIPGGVLFSAFSRQHGVELWRTDGTLAGTSMVLDLVDKDNGGGRPSDLFALGDRLLFLADDGLHGRELWTSDGTGAGTFLVHDTPPYSDGFGDPRIMGRAEAGGISYLTRATSEGFGLWSTDGTAAGTFRLSPEGVSVTDAAKPVGNRLFFAGSDEDHGRKLWTSDGTVAGTRALDVQPDRTFPMLTAYQGSLYFRAESGFDPQVWKSNGTPEGTVPLPFIHPYARLLGEFGGRLWFGGEAGEFGYELWSTDGTEAGTRLLGDIRPGTDSFDVEQLIPAGSRMFLKADDELWVSDGAAAGTRKLGPGRSLELDKAVLLNDRLFFTVTDGNSSPELWVSDGSESGTKPLVAAAGERLEYPTNLVAFEGRLWFMQGGKIWSTDGTSSGTVAELSFDTESFTGQSLTLAGGRLYFSGWTPQTGHELWAIDPQ